MVGEKWELSLKGRYSSSSCQKDKLLKSLEPGQNNAESKDMKDVFSEKTEQQEHGTNYLQGKARMSSLRQTPRWNGPSLPNTSGKGGA